VRKAAGAVKLHTPKTLPAPAQAYFREVAKRAAAHGLTQADAPMLGQLATALWMADAAAQLLVRDGLLMTDQAHGPETELRKHPAVTIWRAAVATADGLAKQFGLTPASRARLGLQEDDGAPSLADVLFDEAVHHGNR
jgi:P27 family predicted phage terminase small subunit